MSSFPPGPAYAFFIEPGDAPTLARLQGAFGPHEVQTAPYDGPPGKALALFFVPGTVPAAHG